MKLHDYLSRVGTQARLASSLGISTAQVWQWKDGRRPVPIDLCAQIELATDGEVGRKDLRPEDWQLIWPELAATATAE